MPFTKVLVTLGILLTGLVVAVVIAEPADEPQIEVVSSGRGTGPAYTSFVHRLKANIHAWWQREGQRQVPPTQRWRVEVGELGRGPQFGVGVWVRKVGVPPVFSGPEWASELVFQLYPLLDRHIESVAAAATAAVIGFLQGQASGTAVGAEQKR